MMRRLVLAVAAALAAAVILPFLRADRFAEPARAALESALGRRVEINGPVRLSPFARGLSLEQVVIHEDPRSGVEPFAYVTELQASPSVMALLRGRLEFSHLRLVAPSVNLAKSTAGGWNVQPLLDRILAARSSQNEPFPELTIDSARINFRIGEWKSAYYLGNAELRAEANSPSELSLYFEGEPARTDRGLRGLGRLSGRGTVRMAAGSEPMLNMSVSLARTSIGEMLMLAQSGASNFGGFFSARGRLSGPLRELTLTGRVQLEEFERWSWLLGNAAGPGIDFEGRLDTRAQRIELKTSAPAGALPLHARLRMSDPMGASRWAALLTVRGAPAESVQALAAELGFRLPGDFQWTGRLDGALSYSPARSWMGLLGLSPAAISGPAFGKAESDLLLLRFTPDALSVPPATFRTGAAETVRLEGEYRPRAGSASFRLHTSGASLERLRGLLSILAGAGDFPLPHSGDAATWRGAILYARPPNSEPQWQATGELRNASLSIPGLAENLQLEQAQISAVSPSLQVKSFEGRLGQMELAGNYRTPPRPGQPHHLVLKIREADASGIERLLLPALRRPQGLLARALGPRPGDPPGWMKLRSLTGDVQIETLSVLQEAVENLRFHFNWTASRIAIEEATARVAGGRLRGHAQIELGLSEPVHSAAFTLSGLEWKGGRVEAEGACESRGTGDAFARSLAIQGTFLARGVELRSGDSWNELAGRFDLRRDREAWKWNLSNVEVRAGGELLTGHGASLADGRIALELAAPGRAVRKIAGRLTGPAWENVP